MIRGNLSVRQLAEFTCRSGDLYTSAGRGVGRLVTAEEGIAKQMSAQSARMSQDSTYQREVSLSYSFACAKETKTLRGRMDGLSRSKSNVCVEEFKCTGQLPNSVDPVDRGQALIYAGLLAFDEPDLTTIEVNVVYIDVETDQERIFGETIKPTVAVANLEFILLCYCSRIERHIERAKSRRSWAFALKFPMPQYRPAQQAVARRVYQAVSSGDNLLLEAPTGSGKTLAILFPTIKSQKLQAQIFFLTSRSVGAQAALKAIQQLDPSESALSVVELTAKEKICFVPGMPCDPDRCEYAKGYFNKVGPAIDQLISQGLAHQENIEAAAMEFVVCPFELSLDTALWADIVIGDYNYILDPVVRLQRFKGHTQLHLLIDEAHQLSPRVRDMLAVQIDRQMIREARNCGHSGLDKRINSVDRALMTLRRQHHKEAECEIDSPDSIERACLRLIDVVTQENLNLEAYPQVAPLYFAATRWIKSRAWLDADVFTHILKSEPNNKTISVRRVCLDAGPYLQNIFSEHGSIIRFSGTVSPLILYQRLHGEMQGHAERALSPFQPEQACVVIVNDIPMYYKQREQSLTNLVPLICDIANAKTGQYLVALPSYDYLERFAQALEAHLAQHEPQLHKETMAAVDHRRLQVLVQARGQTKTDTQTLVQDFKNTHHAVLCIVMGGVLGESVDFSDAHLHGVFLVGLGLPPPSLERSAMQKHFENRGGEGWGRLAAYTQPALVKNIQAAGRLIRSEDDFGVICLIDPRFTSDDVQRFFPSHWRPQITRAHNAIRAVEAFWQNTPVQEN